MSRWYRFQIDVTARFDGLSESFAHDIVGELRGENIVFSAYNDLICIEGETSLGGGVYEDECSKEWNKAIRALGGPRPMKIEFMWWDAEREPDASFTFDEEPALVQLAKADTDDEEEDEA